MPDYSSCPAAPGTYAILLKLDRARRLPVGALRKVAFEPGLYVYVGSARGPGGLAARVGRHLRGGGRTHWHIDYLRQAATPVLFWWQCGRERRECDWTQRLGCEPGFGSIVPGFGASDCRCSSHLIRAASSREAVAHRIDSALGFASHRVAL